MSNPSSSPTKIFAGIGSRETPPDVCKDIIALGSLMAEKGWVLRSGGAEGADKAFETGYAKYPKQMEIYLPWKKFNKNTSLLYNPLPDAFEIAERFHPTWNKCNDAAKKLMARNSYQVLGADLQTPCNLVICWTKDGKASGGTGQALRIAEHYGIKIINLADTQHEKPFLREE